MKKLALSAIALAFAVVVCVGCAPSKQEIEISGAATLNGEPIDLGIVQFFTESAEGGGNVQEGQYTARVPKGELTVRIRGYKYTGPMPEAPEVKEGMAPGVPPQRPRQAITPESMWQNPTYKITIEKKGVYDLNFTTEEK